MGAYAIEEVPLIEVNTTPTELSEGCDIAILGDGADFLPALADRVEQRQGDRGG